MIVRWHSFSSILLNINIAIFIKMIELLLNCALSALLLVSHTDPHIHMNLYFGLYSNVFIGNIEHELWIFLIFSLYFCRAICFYTSSNLLFIKYLIEMMKFYLKWFFQLNALNVNCIFLWSWYHLYRMTNFQHINFYLLFDLSSLVSSFVFVLNLWWILYRFCKFSSS